MSKTKEQAIELGEQQIAQEQTGLSLELEQIKSKDNASKKNLIKN